MRDAVDSLGLARTLVDYNEWANERILSTAAGPMRPTTERPGTDRAFTG